MTPLDKILKRSLVIGGVDYVITLTPQALKLTRKGKRLGVDLKWADIASGESALALALQASLGRLEPDAKTNIPTLSKTVSKAPPSIRRTKRVSTR
jgi:hypothetical protein